jgi:hypothetical protein
MKARRLKFASLHAPGLEFPHELRDDIETAGGRRICDCPRERHIDWVELSRGSILRQHPFGWRFIPHDLA